MNTSGRVNLYTTGLLAALALAGCGGGGGGGNNNVPAAVAATVPASLLPQEPGAPALLNNVPQDGMNWINYRRAQAGMPVLTRNELIDRAAAAHSAYQKTNNIVSHDEVAAQPGFTGAKLDDRLLAAGYVLTRPYAFGEVISATSNGSGFYMAEELVTAIYHRFVIFEPKFREIGTGSATTNAGYTYFTANFAASNGFGPGVGRGNLATWPADGQVQVTANFFSDYESPDPVANVNEVGYPVSVHADIDGKLTVQGFTMRPRGGADLAVKLLATNVDENTPVTAAAIVPLAVLKANTIYDVTFSGTLNNVATTKTWSFTTK